MIDRRRAIGVLGVVGAIALAGAFTHAVHAGMDDGLCVPPDDDISKWHLLDVAGISVRVPPNFTQIQRFGDAMFASTGNRNIAVRGGEGPDENSSGGTFALVDACSTTIGGRPVRLKVLYFTIYDPPQAPSGNRGPRYVALARWGAIEKLPTATAWIVSPDRSELRKLRAVFYSADVGVKVPPPCFRQRPLPAIDSVLDTAAIAMRQQAEPARWPAGFAVLVFQFDTTGAVEGMAVAEGDLSDSTKRALVLLAGTNARERARGQVRLRVTSSTAGFAYEIVEATICPKS